MNRLIPAIPLEDQDAWPLVVIRIVLHDLGPLQPVDHIARLNAVDGQFFVAMHRDSDFPTCDERPHLLQRIGQFRDPSVSMFVSSL